MLGPFKFRRKTKIQFNISFKDQSMHLTGNIMMNYYEPKLWCLNECVKTKYFCLRENKFIIARIGVN